MFGRCNKAVHICTTSAHASESGQSFLSDIYSDRCPSLTYLTIRVDYKNIVIGALL